MSAISPGKIGVLTHSSYWNFYNKVGYFYFNQGCTTKAVLGLNSFLILSGGTGVTKRIIEFFRLKFYFVKN